MGANTLVIDAGPVRAPRLVQTDEGAHVAVVITVTEPGCLMGAPFVAEATKRLRAAPGVTEVEVRFDHALDWKPEDMASEYRERLARLRAAARPPLYEESK